MNISRSISFRNVMVVVISVSFESVSFVLIEMVIMSEFVRVLII